MPVSSELPALHRTNGELPLRLVDGTVLILPASLDAFTTYVILEQETWFEKEIPFLLCWLRPGMVAIDIGANMGAYSVPMARRVGAQGAVFAYEPGSEARGFLERSRERNGADTLHVVAAAVSDRPRDGHLVFGASSELHYLGDGGAGEKVQVTSLDHEDATRAWTSPDFVKIDAEGEEERVLEGGRAFFGRHSPLVMFEVRKEYTVNENLITAFRSLGYGIYRALAGAPLLVPVEIGEPMDPGELNLFAAKPGRAAALAREDFAVEEVPDWTPDVDVRARALELLKAQAFAPAFAALYAGVPALDPQYRDALAAYAAWRRQDLPMPRRYAALAFACRELDALCRRAPAPGRLSTLARVSWEMGRRGITVGALSTLVELLRSGGAGMSEPFWPASRRFDDLAPGTQRTDWFVVSALEQLERNAAYSSLYRSGEGLDWLSSRPFASAEIERRRMLTALRAGRRMPVPGRLCKPADDHLNADVWRKGLVPNTLVPAC